MPDDRESKIVKHLADIFPDVAKDRGYRSDTCVMATRTAIEVLRHFGILVKPVAVALMAHNPASWVEFQAAVQANRPPELRTGDRWSVGVAGTGRVELDDEGYRRWDGHLIAQTPSYLLDLTLGQASRPERNLALEAGLMPIPPTTWDKHDLAAASKTDDGPTVMYRKMDDQRSFKEASDWKTRDQLLIDALIFLIEERMALANARFLPTVAMTHTWQSQVTQFRDRGKPGLEYRVEHDESLPDNPIDILLWRDEQGVLRGILYRYRCDMPPFEKAGNVNMYVDPTCQRQGIGRRLLTEALQRWPEIDLTAQRYTPAGAKLTNAVAGADHGNG